MFISALGLCKFSDTAWYSFTDETSFYILAFISLILAFFMPNFFLGNTHNAVDGKNVAGERQADATVGTSNRPINQRE